MLRRTPRILPVVLASFFLLAHCTGRARAEAPPGNDASDAGGNTGGGKNALGRNSGTDNTAYGFDALAKSSTGLDNAAFGWEALFDNTTGSDNTASGSAALQGNTTGSDNTAAGFAALAANSTGNENTASGANALANNTTGNSNTASGAGALESNTLGNVNTASGAGALQSNTIGSVNAASGNFALHSNTTGSGNTASGGGALEDNLTGDANTASGASALGDNSTGKNNTAVGVRALAGNTTGSGNIALGANAGIKLTSGDNNIYIDSKGASAESGTIRIGKGVHTATFIAGISGTPVSGSAVLIDRKGRLGIQASSARYKRDIETMGSRSRKLMKLRPVTFHYRDDSEGLLQYGLVAEEVAAIYPELVVRGADGKVESVRYHELAPMLLNEVQAQARMVSELSAQNESLRAGLRSLETREQERGVQDAAVMQRVEQLEGQLRAASPTLASAR